MSNILKDVKDMGSATREQKAAKLTELKAAIETYQKAKEEQQALRKEYIANVRANLRGQLNSITIQKEDGSLENLGEKFGDKNA